MDRVTPPKITFSPDMVEDEDLETLGEQLYHRIYPKHAEIAGKLTGMLLELPPAVLSQMLQDEALLTGALTKALTALHLQPHQLTSKVTCKDEDEDSLGEQLFELVDVYNTGHSQKITGMLLEQDKDVVLNLFSDPTLLEEQVMVALKTLNEQNVEDMSDSSDVDEVTDRLGEKLFSVVEGLDPAHANDITGMLLEMDRDVLLQMVSDQTNGMLKTAVQKAQEALSSLK